MSRKQNPLVGKTVTKVWLASDKMAMKFDVQDGEPIIARADADYCSSTWIEGIDAPDALLGTVRSVEYLDMPDLGSVAAQSQDKEGSYDPECIAYYGCKITTEKGACVIDYRNESNGYYGGNLVWPDGDDDYFYGGVYGQNVSNNEWREVADVSR